MAKKNRAQAASRGTRLDPERREPRERAEGVAAPAVRGASGRERLTRRMFLVVEVLLVVSPFAGMAVSGSLNFDAAGIANLQDLFASSPAFAVSFLAACIQPLVAYLLHLAYKHYADGDGGYTAANLVGLLCAEMLMQNVVGLAGIALLLWRVWRPAAKERARWRKERTWGAKAAEVSGAIVVVVLAALCAFASWRINNG